MLTLFSSEHEERGRCLACAALETIYARSSQRDTPLTIRQRNTLIRTRHAEGVSQAELARQFGISYQRVHQIIRGRQQRAARRNTE